MRLRAKRATVLGVVLAITAATVATAALDKATELRGAVYYEDADKVISLLDSGVPVDSRAAGGFTPLMTAVGGSDPSLVRLLLDRGADPTLENDSGMSVLRLAQLRGHPEILALIQAALANSRSSSSPQSRPRQSAPVSVQAAVSAPNNSSVKPMALYGAVWQENMEEVKALLAAGADPNEVNTAGQTPLIAAVRYHNPALTKILLEAGADPNLRDNSGRSARDYAKVTRSPEIRGMLNVAAANSNDADKKSPHYSYCQDMYMKEYNLCGSGSTTCRLSASRHYKQCLTNGTWY